jgi:hypothetical protein
MDSSQLCTTCVIWMICFMLSDTPLNFKCVIYCKLITVDDSHVGYLAQVLSHIEMFCFTVAWLHCFRNFSA